MILKKILLSVMIIDLFNSTIFYVLTNYYKNIIEHEAFNISLIVIFISTLILILDRNNKLLGNMLNKRALFFVLFLALLFIIMLPINKLINNLMFYKKIFNDIYCLFHVIVFIISLFILLLKLFNYKSCNIKYSDVKIRKKCIYFLMLCFSAIIFIYMFSSTTGYYDNDFILIFENNISELSNWHTYAYVFLVSIIKYLFHSTFFIVLIQSCLWLFALYYSLKIIDNNTKNYILLILFAIMQILLLIGFKQVTYLWKDTIFSIGVYLLVLVMLDVVLSRNIFIKQNIIFFIAGFIVANFRHAGIFVVILILFLLIIFFKKSLILRENISLLVIGLFSVFSFFVILFIGDKTVGSKMPKYVSYTVPIYQVGSFVNDGYKFLDSDINYLETLYPLSFWKQNYSKYDGDALARLWHLPSIYYENLDNFNYSKLLGLNIRMLMDKPGLYFKSILELENTLWQITPIEDAKYGFFWNDIYLPINFKLNGSDRTIKYEQGITYNIVDCLEKVLFDNSFLFSLKSRGGFAVYVLIFLTVLCIYKRQYKLIIPIIPLMIWWCLLFISMPLSIVRYITVFIISCPILLLIILNSDDNYVSKKRLC